MSSRCFFSHTLPWASGLSSSGGSRMVWFNLCVTTSYSLGFRPSSPKADQVFSGRRCTSILLRRESASGIPVIPNVFVGAGLEASRKGRHFEFEQPQFVRMPKLPLQGLPGEAALLFRVDADVIATIEDVDPLSGIVLRDRASNGFGQIAGTEHGTDPIDRSLAVVVARRAVHPLRPST